MRTESQCGGSLAVKDLSFTFAGGERKHCHRRQPKPNDAQQGVSGRADAANTWVDDTATALCPRGGCDRTTLEGVTRVKVGAAG